jgi:hypothetical protein
MYTPRQIWQHVTPKAQLLIALALATVLAFSAGLAAGIYGRATYLPTLTTDRNAAPAVVQPQQAAPVVQQRPAVAAPVAGSGSAYDGSAYVEYLTARPAASNPNVPAYVEYLTARPAASNPNVPAFGTGSVYDGGHYGAALRRSPNLPVIGTGSVYDGDHYGDVSTQRVVDPAAQGVMDYLRVHGTLVAPPVNSNVPISGTGSAYDGSK